MMHWSSTRSPQTQVLEGEPRSLLSYTFHLPIIQILFDSMSKIKVGKPRDISPSEEINESLKMGVDKTGM